MGSFKVLAAAAAALLLAACSSTQSPDLSPSEGGVSAQTSEAGVTPRAEPPHRWANRPYTVLGKRYTPVTGDKPMRQRGTASWYGRQFHGKKTSNGEVFDMHSVSAAHKTMELPSYARVTNLENGKSIILRVNDRGPFYGDRIIDLSYEAARRLGYDKKGTAQVEVERITMAEIASGRWNSTQIASSEIPAEQGAAAASVPGQALSAESTSGWSVQAGAFSSADNARAWSAHTLAMLSAAQPDSSYTSRIVRSSDALYRVMIGSGMTRERAASEAARIAEITGSPAFAARH